MKTENNRYPTALGLAIVGAFLLVWSSLGMGIIGADGDPANRMYFAVLAVGLIGGLIARFQPRGMAYTLFAMAAVQALIGAFAIITGLGQPYSGPLELLGLNGFFVALFLASGWLFQAAAREQTLAGAGARD
jgi:hypothetical protein